MDVLPMARSSSPVAEGGAAPGTTSGDEGYVLLAVLLLVFLMLLALTVAAPRVAMELKHDQELETAHRANQYVRAIRMFHKKTGTYPTSIEQLEKTNNQRFLRQRYLDPLTGKDDWRPIPVGQNKTTVKGFFGKELGGLSTGLGAAAGLQSPTGGSGSAFGSASTFGSGSTSGSGFGAGSTGSAGGSTFGSTFGGSPAQATGGTVGGSNTATGTAGNGVQSTDATASKGSAGPMMGVGVPKEGEAFLTVNGVSNYQEWEFIYDPRIEQQYAQNGALGAAGGGGGSGSGTGTGLGTNPFGPATPVTGAGGANGGGTSSTPPPAPQPAPQ